MARKRLSDLLREEVHKTAETEVNPIANKGKQTTQTTRAKTQAGSGRAKAPVVETVEAVLVEDKPPATSNVDAAELTQLKKDLALSQQRETHLQQELTLLQTNLDQQEALIHSLKADLEKASAFKTELEQAKKAAFQLAEENSRLHQELQSAQGQKPKPAPGPKPAPAPEPKPAPIDVFQARQARSLAHPVFPAGSSPGYLSDQDLGWVD